jgi:hypothetical protein
LAKGVSKETAVRLFEEILRLRDDSDRYRNADGELQLVPTASDADHHVLEGGI